MSEQQAEPISAETGSPGEEAVAPVALEKRDEPVAASPEVTPEAAVVSDAPNLAPEPAVHADAPKAEAANVEAADVEPLKPDAPHSAGKIMVMNAGERVWNDSEAGPDIHPEQRSDMFGKRRLSALAAIVALAAVAGAMGGALATMSLGHFMSEDGNHAIETSIARIDADIQALKLGVDHNSRLGMSQFNKTNDRLDKIEKAQAEPAAKLAKLSETVDKLRVAPAPAVAAAPVTPKEVTGSVPPATAAAPKVADAGKAEANKPELGRLPTVDGWILRDVAHGGALIEGRQGIFEVYAGDPVPGLGRVDAIRRQDGHWVVVTSRGLIVAR